MAATRPASESEVKESLERLVDLVNQSLEEGIFHSGVVVQAVALTTNDLEIAHGLGRAPTIVLPLLKSAAAHVFLGTQHQQPMQFVNVKASAAVTVNLLIA